MFDRVTSDVHDQRMSRNLGVAGCLVGFIILLFALTAVKIGEQGPTEAFDHQPRATALPLAEDG